MDPTSARRWSARGGMLLTLAVIAVAAVVRVRYFALGRGFWRDELSLVQNLDTRGFAGLARQLGDDTTAPPLFLWAIKAGMLVGVTSEPGMRILPFAAGLAVLPLTALLARRTGVGWGWTALPVAAIAFVPQIVFYSAQLKPYTLDMAGVTFALVLAHVLARRGLVEDENRRLRWVYLAMLLVLPWASLGCMLTFGPITAWLLVVSWQSRSDRGRHLTTVIRGNWRWLAGLALAGASTLAAALLAAHRNAAVTKFDQTFAPWLSPISQHIGLETGKGTFELGWDWHLFIVRDFVQQNLASPHAVVFAILLVIGWLCAFRRSRSLAILLAIPIATAYGAALVGAYPIGRRLVFFAVPAVVVGLAPLGADLALVVQRLGLALIRKRVPRLTSWATMLSAVASLVLLSIVGAALAATPRAMQHGLRYQFGIDDYRASMQTIAAGYRPGDLIIVGNDDRVAARVYGARLGIPLTAFVMADADSPFVDQDPELRFNAPCPIPARVTSAQRIWLMNSDRLPITKLPAQEVLRARLLMTHEVVKAANTDHVWAALLVRRDTPVDEMSLTPPPISTPAGTVCLVYREIGGVGGEIGDQTLVS